MSMINKEIGEFTVQAYHQGAFKPVSKADVLGKWALLSRRLHLRLPHGTGGPGQ